MSTTESGNRRCFEITPQVEVRCKSSPRRTIECLAKENMCDWGQEKGVVEGGLQDRR